MLSTVDTKDNDPHDTIEVVPDVVQLARVAAEFPTLAPDEVKRPDRQPDPRAASAAPRPRPDIPRPEIPSPTRTEATRDIPRIDIQTVDTPRVDTTFRATDVNASLGRPRNRWATRAALAFVFALASGVGAAAWGRYGADAQAMIENFTPSFTLTSLLPSSLLLGKPAAATAPAETAASPAPADQATQPTAPAPAAAQPADSPAAAAPAAAPSPDTAQLIQSMAHDVATLSQQLDDLKTSIAQLKAGQEQLTREFASKAAEAKVAEAREAREVRSGEPNPHLKLGAPPRPLGTIVRRPPPRPLPPAQAAYIPPPAAPPPVQIAPQQVPGQPDADYSRPPMPVR